VYVFPAPAKPHDLTYPGVNEFKPSCGAIPRKVPTPPQQLSLLQLRVLLKYTSRQIGFVHALSRRDLLASTALFLLGLIAGWAIVTGVLEIVAAIQMRKHISGEWLMVLSGLASVVFGVLLVINPGVGALAVVWIIGAYAIVFGILLIALGFRLRGLDRSFHQVSPRPA